MTKFIGTTPIKCRHIGDIPINKIMLGMVEIFPCILPSDKFSLADLILSTDVGAWWSASDLSDEKLMWRRNLLTYTEQLDSPGWVKRNVTLGAPDSDGLSKVVVGGPAAEFKTIGMGDFPDSSGIIVSCSAKKAELNYIAIGFTNAGGYWTTAVFNLDTGVFAKIGEIGTNNQPILYGIDPVQNGEYRVWAKFVGDRSQWGGFVIMPSADDNPIFGATRNNAGDGVSGIYVGKVQVEYSNGSVPSPYQKITDFDTEFLEAFPHHTLFKDSLGFEPLTGAEQLLGLAYDRRKPPNGKRTNLIAGESEGVAAFRAGSGSNTAKISATIMRPDGQPAVELWTNNSNGAHGSSTNGWLPRGNGEYRFSFEVKNTPESPWCKVDWSDTSAWRVAEFDLENGVAPAPQAGLKSEIQSLGGGWYLCTVILTLTTGLAGGLSIFGSVSAGNNGWQGTTSAYLYVGRVWVTKSAKQLPYQRIYENVLPVLCDTLVQVNTTKRPKWVGAVGQPKWFVGDGIDDVIVSPTMRWSVSDKATIIAGAMRTGGVQATGGLIAINSDNPLYGGTFTLFASDNKFYTTGSGSVNATYPAAWGPILSASDTTSVLIAEHDIATDTSILYENGVAGALQGSLPPTDKGTGNFKDEKVRVLCGEYGASPFRGKLGELLIVSRLLTPAEKQKTATEVAALIGVTLP
jgi:hypothetical protein